MPASVATLSGDNPSKPRPPFKPHKPALPTYTETPRDKIGTETGVGAREAIVVCSVLLATAAFVLSITVAETFGALVPVFLIVLGVYVGAGLTPRKTKVSQGPEEAALEQIRVDYATGVLTPLQMEQALDQVLAGAYGHRNPGKSSSY